MLCVVHALKITPYKIPNAPHRLTQYMVYLDGKYVGNVAVDASCGMSISLRSGNNDSSNFITPNDYAFSAEEALIQLIDCVLGEPERKRRSFKIVIVRTYDLLTHISTKDQHDC